MLEIFTVAAIYYLAMTTVWGVIQNRLEARFGRAYDLATGPQEEKPAEPAPATKEVEQALLEQDAR